MPYLTVHVQVSEQESDGPHLRQLSFITDSDSAASDIQGVGRTVDRLLSSVAKRIDAYLLRIARRLGHGPSRAAMSVVKVVMQHHGTMLCARCYHTLSPPNYPAPLERRTSDVVDWIIGTSSTTCSQCGSPQWRKFGAESSPALKYCKKLTAFIQSVVLEYCRQDHAEHTTVEAPTPSRQSSQLSIWLR
jgi:hypothetical protein